VLHELVLTLVAEKQRKQASTMDAADPAEPRVRRPSASSPTDRSKSRAMSGSARLTMLRVDEREACQPGQSEELTRIHRWGAAGGCYG
jgi:hypothetical protein